MQPRNTTPISNRRDLGFWRGRRVLVTGATGIIGSWLTKSLLQKKAIIVALLQDYNPQSEFIRSKTIAKVAVVSGSLEDFKILERLLHEYEIDTVFHLGAQSLVGVAHRSPLPTFETNIRGTYNLLEACRIHQGFVKRVIIASSDKAYGQQQTLPYTEDMALLGRYPYEVSKSCADLLAQAYAHTYHLPLAIARCANVYGGGDLNWSRVVPGTIRSLIFGERPVIRSNGTYVRDYLYVDDVVLAYQQLAERLEDRAINGEAFNFGPETPYTVESIVETIQRLMGAEHLVPQILATAEGEIHSQYLSSTKAQTLLKWSPQYTLEKGLQETIPWYQEFFATADIQKHAMDGYPSGNRVVAKK